MTLARNFPVARRNTEISIARWSLFAHAEYDCLA
ncbi:hypothetical protein T03_12680 [Trichinella britovi]|uniref:Uncharacterized protein n=1 Tax=Trichinella britovi TaxID=45882 RepID=A0A0V1ANU2_TRIBR|nr:hypothetical protein T03_12680 [Trichinella britovi]